MNKKRMLSILLVIVLCMPYTALKARAEEDVEFTPIYTLADLVGINNNPYGNYILMNDIDMTEETATGGSWDTGHGWTPLNSFHGVLDGNGHRINGMHIYGENSKYYYMGLFSGVSGKIYDLGVTNVCIEDVQVSKDGHGESGIGAIAGSLSHGQISRCYVTGQITGTNSGYTGGIVGNFYCTAKIDNCYNAAEVDGSGIAGTYGNYDTYITECYNVGKVTNYAIGSCGSGEQNYSLYGSAEVEGTDRTDGTVLTEAQMRTQNMYVGFDFDNIWEIDPNSTYPYPQLKGNRHQRVDGVEIVSKPDKTVYDQGEKLDITGGTIKVIYEDNYDTTILMTKNMLEEYDMSETGIQIISVNYGGKVAEFPITVKEIPVQEVTILGEGNTLQKGKRMQLDASVYPENATDPTITWSTNSTCAAISVSGEVKAMAVGDVVVTATASNGVSARYNISITAPCVMLVPDQTALTMYKGEQTVLHNTVSPIDTTDAIEWSSSNETIATVEQDGTVTANSPGKAEITAKADSGISAVCDITVKQKLESFHIEGVVDKQYTGNTIKQAIKVTDGVTQLKDGQDYQVTYSDNIEVGKAKITVTGKGYYEGSLVKDFNILASAQKDNSSGNSNNSNANKNSSTSNSAEKTKNTNVSNSIGKTKITKIKNVKKRKIQVNFKSVKGADGYEIRYSTKASMRSVKKRTTRRTKYTLYSMKRKKYYVQVRAFYYNDYSKKVYGTWSAKKSIKVKR